MVEVRREGLDQRGRGLQPAAGRPRRPGWRRAWPSPARARSGSRSSLRTGRGASGQPDGGPVRRERRAGGDVGAARSSTHGPDHDRPVAEERRRRASAAARGSVTPPRTTTRRSPWTRAEGVEARGGGRASYLVEDVGLGRAAGTAPSTTATSRGAVQPERAGPGQHAPRRPRRAARRRRPAPRAGRPRRRGPPRRGRRPRRWRRRPRGRSAGRRRARRPRRRGRRARRCCARRPRSRAGPGRRSAGA